MQTSPQAKADAPSWTILKILRWTTDYFASHDVDNPRASAEVLLAHALGLERIDLYVRYDQPLVADELARFRSLIKRRVKREPVAYIVGSREFWSLPLSVSREVLIPRPETECLVEAVLGLLPEHAPDREQRILEPGTGSGAIILALAAERPGHHFFASDRSWPALTVARANARRNGQENAVSFFCGDWFAPVRPLSPFHMIVSNPPYIRTADIPTLQPEVSRYEPRTALDGGPDGLAAIGRIIRRAPDYLVEGGYLFLEMGFDQQDEVRDIVERCGVYGEFACIRDYSGHDRIVRMRLTGKPKKGLRPIRESGN